MNKKVPYNGWINFRYLELNGRIRSTLKFPRRERVLVRIALSRIGLRYKELIPFYNPLYKGIRKELEGTIQWLDFVVYHKQIGMFVVQFENTERHERQKRAYHNKKQYIEEVKGLPFIPVKKSYTSQEYEIRIRMFIRKVILKNEQNILENNR